MIALVGLNAMLVGLLVGYAVGHRLGSNVAWRSVNVLRRMRKSGELSWRPEPNKDTVTIH